MTRFLALMLSIAFFCCGTGPAHAEIDAEGNQDKIDVRATLLPSPGKIDGSSIATPNPNIKYESGPCVLSYINFESLKCGVLDGFGRHHCEQVWTEDPIFVSTRPNADSAWSRPMLSSAGYCSGSPVDVAAVIAEEFRSITLTPSAIVAGPPDGWLPVTMDNIVYTTAQPQTISTVLLGVEVLVRATPTRFSWDFADGEAALVTTDPGRPYPDQTLARAYAHVGTYSVTMTTTWAGEFSLDGGVTYSPITGTAVTVSTAPPVDVIEYRTHLVVDPVY